MTPIVITDGIVLGKRTPGEANTLALILTRELGLIFAMAKSAREDRSKLRYGLEPFSVGRYSFVRGKYEWKITGVHDIERPFSSASLESRAAGGRISKLLSRLIRGEESSPQIFDTVKEGFALLPNAKAKEERESLECVLVLRILFHLGYLPKTPELAPFMGEANVSLQLAAEAAKARSVLIAAINNSLSETGL